MANIFDRPGGDADILNRKDYLLREAYIKDKYDVDPKERDRRLDKLFKDYLKDQKLIKKYGEDAMKSKGFNTPRKAKPKGNYARSKKIPQPTAVGASNPPTQKGTPKYKSKEK
tara:strand:- start:263 stop:601 length:339 start_codon:yes stop_codon:yes gene_type:complete